MSGLYLQGAGMCRPAEKRGRTARGLNQHALSQDEGKTRKKSEAVMKGAGEA